MKKFIVFAVCLLCITVCFACQAKKNDGSVSVSSIITQSQSGVLSEPSQSSVFSEAISQEVIYSSLIEQQSSLQNTNINCSSETGKNSSLLSNSSDAWETTKIPM